MFNVGTPELLLILLVALVVLGPSKLPHAARQVGRVMGEFRRMSSGFQDELRDAMQEPVSQSGGGPRRSDPVPKAAPAGTVKPVSKVIPDEVAVTESVAADPSSASPGAVVEDEHVGADDEAAARADDGGATSSRHAQGAVGDRREDRRDLDLS